MPLRYGARVTGVIVISKLGLDQFDADDLRLLEVLSGHASVALENARLYEAQRREAESAKALEFSRELAEATTIADVAQRATAGAAGILESASISVWLQDAASGALARLAGIPRPTGEVVVSIPAERLEPWLSRTEPYTVDAEDYAGIASVPEGTEGRFAIAPFTVDGRWGVIAAAINLRLAPRSRAGAPRQPRAPDAARLADGRQLREARAHVPLHRRGARQRPRGERRVHVDARALDHRPRLARRGSSDLARRS